MSPGKQETFEPVTLGHIRSDAASQEVGGQSKAKVFISYSRKNMAFADRLETALKARGFKPLIDRTDILAFEEWWKRVEVLIGRFLAPIEPLCRQQLTAY
jgi:hypothetical protein